ncbi:HAD hydrolase family protein [Coprobacillaceae bacterium CR2/5/TPMF4]|nr:HAD hydrolase family protein [Coprobacillaceae bacterium CR2/5/TPMF4]
MELMNKYNFNKNDIYVIGDCYNDLSMFEINDIEELNNSAKYVVDSICDCIDIINNESSIKK